MLLVKTPTKSLLCGCRHSSKKIHDTSHFSSGSLLAQSQEWKHKNSVWICSKLIKIPERHWCARFIVFVVNFVQIHTLLWCLHCWILTRKYQLQYNQCRVGIIHGFDNLVCSILNVSKKHYSADNLMIHCLRLLFEKHVLFENNLTVWPPCAVFWYAIVKSNNYSFTATITFLGFITVI